MERTVLLIHPQKRAPALDLREAGLRVVACEEGEGWRRFCEVAPALVLLACDGRAGARADAVRESAPAAGYGAMELLGRMRRAARVPVVLFAREGGVPDAVHAMQCGAADFVLSSGAELEARLAQVARRILARAGEARDARVQLDRRLPGASPAISKVRERIAALARLREPVLFSGARGSGRGDAARALHDLRSPEHPFLEFFAEELVEFPTPPRFGSVYVNNLEALAPALQRRFRERLENAAHAVQPGEHASAGAGVRWLAGSSPGLPTRAPALGFDMRLLRLLARFEVRVPALRARPEDLPRIARALLARESESLGRTLRFSDAALQRLRLEPWPGNVRELADAILKLAAFAPGPVIERDEVREVLAELRPSVEGLRARGVLEERAELLRVLDAERGNVTKTARRLGCSRTTVYRMVERHGVALRDRG